MWCSNFQMPSTLSRPPVLSNFSFLFLRSFCMVGVYAQIHTKYIKLFFIIKVNTFKEDSWQRSEIVIQVISGRHYKSDGDFNTNLHKILSALVGLREAI